MKRRKRWETLCVKTFAADLMELNGRVVTLSNARGADGWELVTVNIVGNDKWDYANPHAALVFFKRPLVGGIWYVIKNLGHDTYSMFGEGRRSWSGELRSARKFMTKEEAKEAVAVLEREAKEDGATFGPLKVVPIRMGVG